MILEERNRIAREIHDGIAQTLAGVIFQLESARKKYHDKPKDMQQVVEKSIKRFKRKSRRSSLFYLCFKTISDTTIRP